jgi:tetratricopeptide (TPR) repeat protein
VLDDLHAADASSLLMLEFVAAELADARVLVLGAYRDPELEPDDPIASALNELARRASGRITLTGLREHEVASYLESSTETEPHGSLVAAIAAETEGNPLFVGEIVRMLAAEGRLDEPADSTWRPAIPETVKEVIGRRLNRLSAGCREALSTASVLGREFGLDLVEQLTGRAATELLVLFDEAGAARIVTDVPGSPGRLRFTHALIRDSLYDSLPHARRLELHRRAGEAIEALAGADAPAHLSELAHHYFRALPAVDADLAVAHARRAAEQAALLLAHEEAARLYETALQALDVRSPPDRTAERTLYLALGEAHARSGDTPRARDAFLRAAALARVADAHADLAAAALGYGSRIAWARPAGDRLVLALLEEALEAVGEEETPLRARILARLAGCLRDERDGSRRVAVGELAVATARRVGDDATLTFALAGLAAAQHGISDYERRLSVTTELLQLARATGRKEEECEALMAETLVYFESNDVAEVRHRAALITAIADDLRQAAQRWFATAQAAMLALHDGRFAEAEALSAQALEIGERSEGVRAVGPHAVQLFILRREQGRAAEALDALVSVAEQTPTRPFFRAVLGALYVELGQLSKARLLFEDLAANGFEIVPRDNEWLLAAHYLAETCCALQDTVRAATLLEELEPIARRAAANVPEGSVGTLARSIAHLAELLGRDNDAAGLLEQAIELDRASGARPWVAHAQVDLASILARQGQDGAASSLLAEAAATAAELGMTALKARIAEAQDYAGSSPSQ